MANAIENYKVITLNPFLLGPLIVTFFANANAIHKDKSLLLAYLVLPLVLPYATREFLEKARSTSNLRTMIMDPKRLCGLSARIEAYRELTNECIMYAIETKHLDVTENLGVQTLQIMETAICPGNTSKAAARLGQIFAPFGVVDIYRSLGISKL